MAQMTFDIGARDLKSAIREKVTEPLIALGQNRDVMRQIANRALQIVEPYVPYKTGALNSSAHIVQHARYTQIAWGKPGVGRTMSYAEYQHNNIFRHRTRTVHPYAKSFWTKQIAPGSPGYRTLVNYATPLVKKEVKKNGR